MTDSVEKQCHDAIVAAIQAIGLEGVQSTEVVLRKVPRDRNHLNKGVTVSPVKAIEAAGTNERDDFGYAALVTLTEGTSNGGTENMGRVSLWREQIRKVFHNKRLSAVALSVVCSVGHGDSFLPKELQGHNDVSTLLIRCWTREGRT